jgi:hypothetical protein
MHRTTVNFPDPVLREARLKALHENVTLSHVLRNLLTRWVTGEISLASKGSDRDRLVAMARDARGMWADRDGDDYLALSRAGLVERDEELRHARLDSR